MDIANSKTRLDGTARFETLAGPIAVYISLVSAVFYFTLSSTADPLAATSIVDTAPLETESVSLGPRQ